MLNENWPMDIQWIDGGNQSLLRPTIREKYTFDICEMKIVPCSFTELMKVIKVLLWAKIGKNYIVHICDVKIDPCQSLELIEVIKAFQK